VEVPSLLTALATRTQTPVVTFAEFSPALLSACIADRYGYSSSMPLLHTMQNGAELSPATFDRLEALTGGAEFLNIRNARGETSPQM
jgi:hypothetical protein